MNKADENSILEYYVVEAIKVESKTAARQKSRLTNDEWYKMSPDARVTYM